MGAETINLSSLRIEPAIFGRVIIPLKVEGREAGAAAGFLKDEYTARGGVGWFLRGVREIGPKSGETA